ncbi:hypothetical protein GCM10023172_05510 [Hymenobacter ginsengisoli]|uniref:Uncharacterized protein n=1 Tax=Hymenobacter ginsengisoli TaxID=1051626 RepID=A0ABP8PYH6_9BACT|nr:MULTISPECIES: hypothetical protein [unclassified Hymenobacter]MBO2030653.1 hypothetical protein [Hymenobacter sp. BT559]
MARFITFLLLVLLAFAEASPALAAPRPGRHHPRYTAYKHRGDARKRWRRMGILGRWRYHRRYRKAHPRRGVIRVGPPRATMPKH